MYKISKYSNKIKNTNTGDVFLYDEREPLYSSFFNWLSNGGGPEFVEYLEEELTEINTPIYEEKIIEHFTYLMNRALSSSMGKYGSYEYLQIQKREYDNKYLVAKGLEVNTPISNAIQKEMERDFPVQILDAILTSYGYPDLSGTQIEKMHILIIIRYEYAKSRLDSFEGMAIDFRTKCRTLVELHEWSKLDTAFDLVSAFPENPTNTDIENYYNQFDAL